MKNDNSKRRVCLYTHKSTSYGYYTGVTSDLQQRISQHLSKFYPGSFTAKYNCNKLVWYESFAQISDAIMREKQIKSGSRSKKTDLIYSLNPKWNDLWESDVKFW